MSWEDLWPLLLDGTLDTLYMVGLAALFTVLIGLPTGVLLFISRANGLAPMPKLNALLGAVINIGRSLPFIVLLIALIPFTRLIVGTTLGSTAAIVPVTIGAFPFFARLTENALDEVDYGRIEAILSMGGNVWHVIFKSLLPEALPTLLAGITLTIVMLIGFSSMAGVIGGGGLGDLAIRYGYQRFNNEVMFGTVLILGGDGAGGANGRRSAGAQPRPTAASRQSLVPAALCRQLADQSGGVTLADQPHPLPGPVGTILMDALGFRGGGQCFADIIRQRIIRHGARRIAFPQRTEGIRQTACRTPGYRGGQHRTPVKAVVDRRAIAGVGGRFRTQ
ncbi:ABC transporter permease [Klebsiella pneumoniae]|nr:ABC transporter permease [Klebsiella pneumoniae]